MRFARLSLIAGFFLLLLSGCSGKGLESDKPKLGVAVEPQKAILKALSGDEYDIVTMFAGGSDPETFDPSMRTLSDLGESKAYFRSGYLPMEDKVIASLQQQDSGPEIVEISKGIVPIEGTHGSGKDPHIWASPRNQKIIAANMLQTLSDLNPSKEGLYRQRFDSLMVELDALDNACSKAFAGAPNKSFMIWHPSLGYLARDYDLVQIGVETDGKEASPAILAQKINEAKRRGAKLVIIEKGHDPRSAERLASEIGGSIVEINLLSPDISGEIYKLANAFEKGR